MRSNRGEDVAHTSVIDRLSTYLACTVRPMGEDKGINTVHRGGKSFWAREIADDCPSFTRKLTSFGRAAHECANCMSLANCFFNDKSPDASGGPDCQYGQTPTSSRLLFVRRAAQQRLNRAALVHGAVTLRHLIQGEHQIEHLSGVDRALQHEFDQIRQVTAHWSRATVETDKRDAPSAFP